MTEEKLIFEGPKDGPLYGYTMKAVEAPEGNALVEMFKDGQSVRRFLYPAYKVWNLAAHFSDLVDSEVAGDMDGYALAGSDGLGGCVMPQEEKG